MDSLNWMLLLIGCGFTFMTLGFSARESPWGIAILALGSITMLSTIAYKMYITFYQ